MITCDTCQSKRDPGPKRWGLGFVISPSRLLPGRYALPRSASPRDSSLLIFLLAAILTAGAHGKAGSDGVGSVVKHWKYYLTVGAVFRDEDLYLREWLEFHCECERVYPLEKGGMWALREKERRCKSGLEGEVIKDKWNIG